MSRFQLFSIPSILLGLLGPTYESRQCSLRELITTASRKLSESCAWKIVQNWPRVTSSMETASHPTEASKRPKHLFGMPSDHVLQVCNSPDMFKGLQNVMEVYIAYCRAMTTALSGISSAALEQQELYIVLPSRCAKIFSTRADEIMYKACVCGIQCCGSSTCACATREYLRAGLLPARCRHRFAEAWVSCPP